MKLEMTYMILHHNSWMSVPAQAGILAGICTLWLGILLVYNIDVGDLIGGVAVPGFPQYPGMKDSWLPVCIKKEVII